MSYITANIRIPEEDYIKLKAEAYEKKKSFSAVIREKIKTDKPEDNVEDYFKSVDALRNKIGDKLKGFDVVEFLRKDRYEGHKINNY